MLSLKQSGINYHFLSDSTWGWTPVSRTIGKITINKDGTVEFGGKYYAISSWLQITDKKIRGYLRKWR